MRALAGLLAALLLAVGSGAAAHLPRGIAVAPDGRVYFSALQRIWSIPPGGRAAVIRASAGAETHDVFLDEGGHLWGEDSVHDPSTRRNRSGLWMIAPDGRTSYTYGPTARPTFGAGVFRDRFGCSFSAGETVGRALMLHRLCPGGQPELLSGRGASGRIAPRRSLANVGGAAFGPDGSFYFRHHGIVQRLRAGDRLVTAATGFAPESFGIAVDGRGALYVAEHRNGRIVRVQPDGRRSVPIRSELPWAPTGIAVQGGALYVLEASDRARGQPTRLRVRRIGPDRSVTLLGTVPLG